MILKSYSLSLPQWKHRGHADGEQRSPSRLFSKATQKTRVSSVLLQKPTKAQRERRRTWAVNKVCVCVCCVPSRAPPALLRQGNAGFIVGTTVVCLLQQNPYRVARALRFRERTQRQRQHRACGTMAFHKERAHPGCVRVFAFSEPKDPLLLFVPTSADPSITRERD